MLQEVQRRSSLSNPSGSSCSWVRVTQPPNRQFRLREKKITMQSNEKSEDKNWGGGGGGGGDISSVFRPEKQRVIFHENHVILHPLH